MFFTQGHYAQHVMETEQREDTTIGVRRDVLQEIRSMKRGGESYNSLLAKMAEQYDPDAAHHQADR